MEVKIILGLVRHLLTTFGGAAVANGVLSSDDLSSGVGALVTLIGIAWSIYEKKTAAPKVK